MVQVRQVALAFSTSVPHHARALQGIVDFAREVDRWRIHFLSDIYMISLEDLREWPGHGAIALIETPSQARMARRLGFPVVNLSGAMCDAGMPRVMVDQVAIGRLAAEHLFECGFRRFGYYGPRGIWFSQLRLRGFAERVKRQGGSCSVLEVPGSVAARRSWRRWQDSLQRWLKTLKPPVGILAASDARGAMLVDACERIGLRVPDDVAVIGVDNHEATCELCHVPLSSISRNDRKIGYEAASLLERLMAGWTSPGKEILVAPDGVVRRRSTEVLAVEDPHVAVVVRFVREHVHEVFGVERLVPLVPLSRRWLEHRFRSCLAMTPHEFICRTRVERAKQLLAGPQKVPLGQVSRACGFAETRRFRLVFHRITGTTPAEFRRESNMERLLLQRRIGLA